MKTTVLFLLLACALGFGAGVAARLTLPPTTRPAAAASPLDANGDGVVSIADAQCILRQLAQLPATPVCPNPLPHGDVNGDGQVTITDAICVLRALAEEPATPVCPATLNRADK